MRWDRLATCGGTVRWNSGVVIHRVRDCEVEQTGDMWRDCEVGQTGDMWRDCEMEQRSGDTELGTVSWDKLLAVTHDN